MTRKRGVLCSRFAALVIAAACPAALAANTWTGGAGSDWFNTGNWSEGHAPAAGEDVIITNAGAVPLLTNTTADLNSLTVSNKTLICSNWTTQIRALTVTLQNGGVLTLPPAFTNTVMSNRIHIVCTDLTMDPGSRIDVDAKGFGPYTGPGAASGAAWHGAGGGYGGRGGGSTSTRMTGGRPYGSVEAPIDPGSGGTYSGTNSGNAGGAIRIEASGAVTVNGTISANGIDTINLTYGIGSGSGGGIYITCDTFGGTTSGLVRAKGGSADYRYTGGGGGGRIAVDYANLGSPHAVRFLCSPGVSCPATPTVENSPYMAQMGTLWLPDTQLLAPTLADQLFTDCELVIPGFTNWAVESLSISNCSFHIQTNGFVLTATNGIILQSGGIGIRGDIATVEGDLVVTNGGKLWIYSAATNGAGPDYGSLVSVTGSIVVGSGSWIFPYAEKFTGGGVLFRAENVVLAPGGGINADGLGYGLTNGPGRGTDDSHGCGAAYGGHGGRALSYTAFTRPYGSAEFPLLPGSGTGGRAGTAGAPGGGLVRIEATNSIAVHGTISANGGRGLADADGNASGGGVSIACDTFGGGTSGLVRANGGPKQGYGGGGGGGRIAVHYAALAGEHGVRFSCSPSAGYFALPAEEYHIDRYPRKGTVWFPDAAFLAATTWSDRQFQDVRLILGSLTSLAYDSLTISNWDATLEITNLVLTVTNGLRIASGGKLGVYGTLVTEAGDLVVTNGGVLRVFSNPTNSGAEYGALVSVTGDLVVGAASWIYPFADRTNGGAPLFRVGNLGLDAGGGFDADGRGYPATNGPGSAGARWHGPGAGHGGRGGPSSSYITTYGGSYDSTNAPRRPGSGASHTDANAWSEAGAGGGVIRIEAEALRVDGTLTANGKASEEYRAGGGAGGTIFVFADGLVGATSGLIQASGGTVPPSGVTRLGGGGGGGRVSIGIGLSESEKQQILAETPPMLTIYQSHSGFDGAVLATGSLGYVNGEDGTRQFMAPFTWILTISGVPGNYDSPHPHSYGEVGTLSAGTWVTNTVSSPADEAAGARHACLGYSLTNLEGMVDSGSGTQVVFQLTTNLWLTWFWTNEYYLSVSAGPNGSVNDGVVNGWYTNATEVTNVEATADGGFVFTYWSGPGVPAGQEFDNPLAVTMDQARTLQANFADATPQTRVWTGTGVWESASNWSPSGVPAPYDDVIVRSGLLVLGNSRGVTSLVVSNGATLVFTNWTTRLAVTNDMVLRAGAVVTLPPAFTDSQMSNRVWLTCSNLTMEPGSRIDASGRGYVHNAGPGAGGGTWHSAGGSHGGLGGYADNASAPVTSTYGSVSGPTAPGSGGGGADGGGSQGGGAVRIEATGSVIVDGTINANGSNATAYAYGGGSGGSVWITCATFGGSSTGSISAHGGNTVLGGAYYSGGGGGGRIAVQYAGLAEPHAVRLGAARATAGWADFNRWKWEPWSSTDGTLWLPDTNLLADALANGVFQRGVLTIPGFTSWDVGSLVVSGSFVRLAGDGFQLAVANTLSIRQGELALGGTNGNAALSVGGDLVLSNSATLSVYAGEPSTGGRGASVSVDGTLSIGPGSWIRPYSHPTNGASVYLTAGNMLVSTGAGFNADCGGYGSDQGPGTPVPIQSSGHASGAGYGGLGGPGESFRLAFGPTYGSTNAPRAPGSGGTGICGTPARGGGYGGGLIWINLTGSADVAGTMTANGGYAASYRCGGGSGGGIFLVCGERFSGAATALLRAEGGSMPYNGPTLYGGGGGGGRIAVWHGVPDVIRERILLNPEAPPARATISNLCDAYLGFLSVTNGLGWSNGLPGTAIFLNGNLHKGVVFMVR